MSRSIYPTEVFASTTAEKEQSDLLPSFVFPGTKEAYLRGCVCPVEENINRLKLGAQPLLRRDCRVHAKVCQAEKCGHGEHIGMHERCEHCTNILHTCVICESVYLEDGFDPAENGWVYITNELGEFGRVVERGWRCRRCR